MTPLWEAGLALVSAGITTSPEVARVIDAAEEVAI
jgi:hypothetical protein